MLLKEICRKKNSEGECIPLICLEHVEISCLNVTTCPVPRYLIEAEAQSFGQAEKDHERGYMRYLEYKRKSRPGIMPFGTSAQIDNIGKENNHVE